MLLAFKYKENLGAAHARNFHRNLPPFSSLKDTLQRKAVNLNFQINTRAESASLLVHLLHFSRKPKHSRLLTYLNIVDTHVET